MFDGGDLKSLREILEVWEVWVCDFTEQVEIGGDFAGSRSGSKEKFEGKKKRNEFVDLKKLKNTQLIPIAIQLPNK